MEYFLTFANRWITGPFAILLTNKTTFSDQLVSLFTVEIDSRVHVIVKGFHVTTMRYLRIGTCNYYNKINSSINLWMYLVLYKFSNAHISIWDYNTMWPNNKEYANPNGGNSYQVHIYMCLEIINLRVAFNQAIIRKHLTTVLFCSMTIFFFCQTRKSLCRVRTVCQFRRCHDIFFFVAR